MDIVVLAQIFYRLWKSPLLVTIIIIDIVHLIVFKTINKKLITMKKKTVSQFKKGQLCVFLFGDHR